MTRLTFEPIFESTWGLLVLAGVLLAIPWLVPVASRSLTPRQQRILQIIRTATSLVLLLAVLRPTLLVTDSVPTEASLVLLVDRSRSMSLSADATRSRWDVQVEMYRQLMQQLQGKDDALAIKTLVYAGQTSDLGSSADTVLGTEPPSGDATDIQQALQAAIQSAAGKPLAGVVLMGDGVEVIKDPTGAAGPRDELEAARLLASLDVPLWTLAIGPAGDLNQVRDVEVAGLEDAYQFFAGNEANVDIVIKSRALAGQSLPVTLRLSEERKDAPKTELATRVVVPRSADDSLAVSVPVSIAAPGKYRLEVVVEGQEGETLLTNNSQNAFVDVKEGGGRVLYLEGQPRPEQHFLLRTLRRFPDLQVNYRWIAADSKSRWPIDLGLDKATGQPDVYLIGDLPAAAIGTAQLEVIAKRVGEGASLLMLGGLDSFAKGGYAASPLADVLPVRLDPQQADLEGEVIPVVTQSHPVIQLSADRSIQDQDRLWKSLGAFRGANRFDDIRVAPGIEVLLETEAGDPLLVLGEFGSGRVIAFAVDTTYRWWREGKSLEHRRFWRQALLWLLDRDPEQTDGLEIQLAQRRVDPSTPLRYVVSYPAALAGAANPQLVITSEDGEEISVNPERKQADGELSRLEGALENLEPGMYQFSARLEGKPTSTVSQAFQVLADEAELRFPFADHGYLEQLASQTASAGGAAFTATQFNELLEMIAQLRRSAKALVLQKHRFGDTPSTAWPLFLLLAGLMSVEWYLRRRWGLA